MASTSRRDVLGGAGAAAAVAFAGGAGWANEPLEGTLVVRTTGGVFEQASKRNFFDPFTKATGTRIMPVATPMAR